MPEKTVYISYRPNQSLHVAQPLFNSLRQMGYDVFMDINDGVDAVNLNQVAAREHFVMILPPGSMQSANDPEDRLVKEFEVAIRNGRNILLLLTKDFNFNAEMQGIAGVMALLPQMAHVRLQPKQLSQLLEHLDTTFFQKSASKPSTATPPDEEEAVQLKIAEAKDYSKQTTIRLNTEKLFFRAVVKIRRGDYDGALNDLDLVIADNPNNESAFLQRGRVLRKKGRKIAALKDYEQATQLSPKLVAAHIGRGELLLETGRQSQAMEAFRRALDLQSESAPAIAGMALTHHAMEETEEALRLWNWLIERDRNYADATWAGEVFDWDDSIVERAQELVTRL